MKINAILAPIDFSECSSHALAYAADLAKALGAKLEVLHVWHLSAYSDLESDLAKSQARELRAQLEAAVAKIQGQALSTHLEHGVPFEVIQNKAKELGCGLIVMGTTAKSSFEHFLLGSVAERVLRESSVPVLTVRK